jgi:hypothetical protein
VSTARATIKRYSVRTKITTLKTNHAHNLNAVRAQGDAPCSGRACSNVRFPSESSNGATRPAKSSVESYEFQPRGGVDGMTIRAEHIVAIVTVINNASDTVVLCIATALLMVACMLKPGGPTLNSLGTSNERMIQLMWKV